MIKRFRTSTVLSLVTGITMPLTDWFEACALGSYMYGDPDGGMYTITLNNELSYIRRRVLEQCPHLSEFRITNGDIFEWYCYAQEVLGKTIPLVLPTD